MISSKILLWVLAFVFTLFILTLSYVSYKIKKDDREEKFGERVGKTNKLGEIR